MKLDDLQMEANADLCAQEDPFRGSMVLGAVLAAGVWGVILAAASLL